MYVCHVLMKLTYVWFPQHLLMTYCIKLHNIVSSVSQLAKLKHHNIVSQIHNAVKIKYS